VVHPSVPSSMQRSAYVLFHDRRPLVHVIAWVGVFCDFLVCGPSARCLCLAVWWPHCRTWLTRIPTCVSVASLTSLPATTSVCCYYCCYYCGSSTGGVNCVLRPCARSVYCHSISLTFAVCVCPLFHLLPMSSRIVSIFAVQRWLCCAPCC
jgi:hypothetical protein